MLSAIGFVAVLLIVFSVGFTLGCKPGEPLKINLKFEEFTVEDLQLCRDLLESAAERIQEELDSYEYEDDEDASEEEEEKPLIESEEANQND